MWFLIQKMLFLFSAPTPVRNVTIFPDARNITVSWTKPDNIFGVLESYSVIRSKILVEETAN